MNREESINYWTEQKRHAEAALEYATAQLGKLTVDEMLMGDWLPYDDQGNYMNRTIPDVSGRDL